MAGKFAELLVTGMAPVIESVVAEKFAELLRRIEPDATRKNICQTLYIPINTELSKLAAETKTKLDDIGVEIFKQAIETVATEDGFSLPQP